MTRSRPDCFGTKFGRACTKSTWSWPRATLGFIWRHSGWRYDVGSSQVTNRRLFDAASGHNSHTWRWLSWEIGLSSYGAIHTFFVTAVQDQLKNVQQIQASRCGAFAAILADGSVVTLGSAQYGGNSSSVQDQLKNVQQIQASHSGAFAAILADGSVVT